MAASTTSTRVFRLTAGLFAAFTALFGIWVALELGGGRATDVFDDLGELVAALVGGAYCTVTARRAKQRWAGWGLIAASCLAWAAGEVVWCYYDLLRDVPVPFPSLADVGFLSAVPLEVAGLLTLPGSRSSKAMRLRELLDGVLVGSAVFFISWATVLATIYKQQSGTNFSKAVGLAYPLSDVVVCSLVFLLASRATATERAKFGLVLAGLLCFTLADSSFAYLTTTGHYGFGNAMDTGWVMGYLLIALGALWSRGRATETPGSPRTTLWGITSPYLPASVAGVVTIARVAMGMTMGAVLQTTGLVIVAAMGGRQMVSLLDNISLTRQLEARVQQRTDELRHQSLHDDLTGLPNRALFERHLHNAVQRRERSGALVAVLLLDLDKFKQVNDLYGYEVGDELLRLVAARLRITTRGADTVARLGVDEFGLLVEGPAGALDVERVVIRVMAELAKPFRTGAGELTVKASIGIASDELDVSTADEMLRNAGLANQAAKAKGGNRAELYVHQDHSSILERIRTETELNTAVERRELVVYYQPVVELKDERIGGAEALVRWAHPVRGLVSPLEFIPLAEKTGSIVAIGTWVLRRACSDMAAVRHEGSPLWVSVNVSPRQLVEPDFIETVAGALAFSGLEPARLTLEITESVLVEDTDEAVRALNAVRRLGVRVAIDDFGTGYSSLGTLHELPVDILKIDRSFVTDIATSRTTADLTKHIIQLARDFGLKTVAEGVELAEQLEILRALNCDAIQGYFFAKPQPLEELLGLLSGPVPSNR